MGCPESTLTPLTFPFLPMVATSFTEPLAPVCLAIFGYSGSFLNSSVACWICPPALDGALTSEVETGAAGAGATGAAGRGAAGPCITAFRLTPGTGDGAAPADTVGASGRSKLDAGRSRCARGSALNGFSATAGLVSSFAAGSSAGVEVCAAAVTPATAPVAG